MLSRVAENLYWMSRYLERAEHTSRLIAVKLESMIEQSKEEAEASWRRVIAALTSEEHVPATTTDPYDITQALVFDRFNTSSLISSLRFARDNGRQVREQISTEMWSQMNRQYLRLAPLNMSDVWNDSPAQFFRDSVEQLNTLEGITYSTMRHGEGWHFLQLGRYMERAQLISRLLELHYGAVSRRDVGASVPKTLDWIVLLRFCTAFEAYCKVYTATIRRDRIAEFLLFDAEFPHSVRFAVERLTEALSHVATGAPAPRRAACERLAGRLKASVDFGQIDELIGGTIDAFLANIVTQCEQIHTAVYAAYIEYGAETVV